MGWLIISGISIFMLFQLIKLEIKEDLKREFEEKFKNESHN